MMKDYLCSLWNLLDLLCILLFVVGMSLFTCYGSLEPRHPLEEWGRIAVVLSLVCFYLRALDMFAVSRALGPKIQMIGSMFLDMGVIAAILAVVVVAFAVAFRALLAPDDVHKEFSFFELRDLVGRSWWPMFGEFFTKDTENLVQHCDSANRSTNDTYCRMIPSVSTALIIQGLFVVFTNLLLFNVLIAMFKCAALLVH